ncbi:MAG: cobyrinate a,c-diamide synthase [Deltaproteobacteria bacterium]|nr:cobyrinate a,c-diamide synthase [Deltaproteobacteria bacterium]
MEQALPRLAIVGLAGDTGKTLVSLGLVRVLRKRGLKVAPFKKGPDFIDAAWLGAAAGVPGHNLDTFLMPEEAILGSLSKAARNFDIAVMEGNRGLFDGLDAQGSHSTAQLAKLTGTPVVLVLDTTKATRTLAAQVLGCQKLDPQLELKGVILNRVGTSRQEMVIREAIVKETGLEVLGAIPRVKDQHLPSRHLGLVTALEHPGTEDALEKVATLIDQHVDVNRLIKIAGQARLLDVDQSSSQLSAPKSRVKIGFLKDRAFSFYYPENLAALEAAGAELWPISPIDDTELPPIDGLYAGGGFPEVHADVLSANSSFRKALADRISNGLPVWAECGGLMYLSQALIKDGQTYPMVGALPIVVEHTPKPQGHGYVRARVDGANPFLAEGTDVCGHEFHYSRLQDNSLKIQTVLKLQRGVGVGQGRDGIQVGGVVATYTHVHALGMPEWATGLVAATQGSSSTQNAGGLH